MIDSPILMDAAERECAENDLSTTYLIEAAAGTGKTTLLVRRILTIVRTTLTPLSRVAAITFTEKAAGELKVKLREKLEQGARVGDEDSIRYAQALQELDAMPVSTIHAFCRDLISQRPVEAQVDPGFSVCDEQTGRMLRDEAWTTWIQKELAGECPAVYPFLRRQLSIGDDDSLRSLRSLFEQLNDYREHLAALHVTHRSETELRARWNQLLAQVAGHCALMTQCRSTDDSLYGELIGVRKWLIESENADFGQMMTQLSMRPKVNGNKKGKAQNWPPEALTALREYFLSSFNEQAGELTAEFQSFEAAPLVEWMKGGVEAYRQLKQDRGLLDFHDLLIGARDMLKSSREAREYFKKRYDYLLVDEFQDTDPLQAEIVFFLAERSEHFAEDWYDVVVEFGKLFIVGDPKQSIYRFRRADLDLYGRVKEKIAAAGQTMSIFMNFRSHPDILSEVNTLFEEQMTGVSGTRYEPSYVAMEPALRAANDCPSLVMLPPPFPPDKGISTAELAQREAACIAQYIQQLAQTDKRYSYRDIGILYSTTTHLASLENALRAANIPYQITGGKDLPRRSEIQALRTVLKAVDNPHDAMSVVGALRSPFFSCSDEELLRHRMANGRFDYTAAKTDIAHLARCFDILRELYQIRRSESPAAVMSALFDRTKGLHIFSLKPQGEIRVANLQKILDLARSFASGGSYSLHRLVRWLDRLDDLRVGEDDSIRESGDDVVQLSTFHKAKGLEFPVVILYRLNREQDVKSPFALIQRADQSVELTTGGIATAGYAEALGDERDRAWHETIRLLYVAMTRARSLLVLPLYWSKDMAKSGQQGFTKILQQRYRVTENGLPDIEHTKFQRQDTTGYDLTVPLQERFVMDPELPPDAGEIEAAVLRRNDWRTRRDSAVGRLVHDRSFLKPSGHEDREDFSAQVTDRWSLNKDASAFGSFVHRVMEMLSFPKAENLDSALTSAAVEYAMPREQQDDARRLITRILLADLFTQRVFAASQVWRELEFTSLLNDRAASGAMDLVFIDAGSPVIVDYKTDRIEAVDIDRRSEFYAGQAAVYLRSLEQILGQPVKEVVLVYMRPGITASLSRERLLNVPL